MNEKWSNISGLTFQWIARSKFIFKTITNYELQIMKNKLQITNQKSGIKELKNET